MQAGNHFGQDVIECVNFSFCLGFWRSYQQYILVTMASTAIPATHIAAVKPGISFEKSFKPCVAAFGLERKKEAYWTKLASTSHTSSTKPMLQCVTARPMKFEVATTRAMASANESSPLPGLPIDLRGLELHVPSVKGKKRNWTKFRKLFFFFSRRSIFHNLILSKLEIQHEIWQIDWFF